MVVHQWSSNKAKQLRLFSVATANINDIQDIFP